MKKSILFSGALLVIVSLVSCTSDDFEGQTQKLNKIDQNNENLELYARAGDSILVNNATHETEGANDGDPIIIIKKD